VSRPALLAAFTLSTLFTVPSAPADAAAPRTSSPSGKAAYRGKPTARRGDASGSVSTLPSAEERTAAVKALTGGATVAIPAVWAAVSVRSPRVKDKAALSFVGADVVDARQGLATWGAGGSGMTPFSLPNLCEIFGCPGGESTEAFRGLQLWVDAKAGHDYIAVCRVRFADKVGDVRIVSDDSFDMTLHVDHTGKSSGRVSFLVDPSAAGWYGFSIGAQEHWTTSGCTVDEI
jgi:hypothetical protein